ncbi:MAG: flagellar basal body protein [Pseudomonadota bacterium]
MKDLTILNQASALARHAGRQHAIVAENIANADTPGFKARTLPAFDPKLAEDAQNGSLTAARRLMEPTELRTGAAAPNGNTVSLDEQMALSVDAQGQHRAAMAVYRKTLELLRLSVTSR